MATEPKPSLGKIKSSNQDSKGKMVVNKKKIDGSTKQQPPDSKQHKSVSVIKTEIKSSTSSSSKTVATTTTRVREKKVYTLPGQKYDPPEEREPLRIFYESLSKQIPTSEMAEFWMMEHGLLSPEKAKKAHEKKQRKQKQLRMGTPVKSQKPLDNSIPESSGKQKQASKNGDVKAKKRLNNDDDFILGSKRRKG